jgi:hypothetical protein
MDTRMAAPDPADASSAVQRDTVKHGPRVDDTLWSEDRSLTTGAPVEARSREDRVKEGLDEDVPGTASRPDTTNTAGMPAGEARLRTELVERLASAPFPCDFNALLRHVGEADGRGNLAARLRMLPADHLFRNTAEVLHFLSGTSLSDRAS